MYLSLLMTIMCLQKITGGRDSDWDRLAMPWRMGGRSSTWPNLKAVVAAAKIGSATSGPRGWCGTSGQITTIDKPPQSVRASVSGAQ